MTINNSQETDLSQELNQRDWKYLTEEEIGQAEAQAIKLGKPFDVNFARQIEQILRKKNSFN